MVDLSVVIVSWNVRDLLRRCLLSLPASARGLVYEVFVVDNASADGTPAMIRSEFADVALIENTENVGFTHGNNQALAQSTGRYVVLLNPDTEATEGSLATLVSYLDNHPQTGAAGPQLVYPDGAIQSSRRRFPDLKTLFVESTLVQRFVPKASVLRRFYMLDKPHDVVQDVDWVVGACLMARREVVAAVGLLDERFFMYCEEMDWCLRIKQQGWSIAYIPAARVIHHEARSSEQALPVQHINFFSSRVAYVRKHFSSREAEALRLWLLTMYMLRMVEEGAKWLIGHKRPLRAQRLALYRHVLCSGLQESDRRRSKASRP